MVTTHCSGDGDYDATLLELIERWLSAHLYTIKEMRRESEKAGSVSAKKQSKVDLGLQSSHYGQQAMLLDYNGHLAVLNKNMKEGKTAVYDIAWVGTDPDED
jgi:hypothetical protein